MRNDSEEPKAKPEALAFYGWRMACELRPEIWVGDVTGRKDAAGPLE